eukprot:COSAG06_NODE_53140_length_301_cov_2.069307_1_plen_64_part_01
MSKSTDVDIRFGRRETLKLRLGERGGRVRARPAVRKRAASNANDHNASRFRRSVPSRFRSNALS